MTRRGIASIVLLLLLVTACGGAGQGDDPEPEGTTGGPAPTGDSLVGLVRTLPEIPDADTFVVTFGDVAGIAEANGVSAPADGDLDELIEWALSGGVDGVPVLLPQTLQEQRLATHDEYDAELGVSLWGTERFAGVDAPPYRVAVVDGDHDAADLTEAIGEPEDGVWSVGGEELETDIANTTAARPLGEGLRLAVGDQGVAIASTERLAVDAADTTGSLVDDDLDEVLAALDETEPVSGVVVRTQLGSQGLTTSGAGYARDGDEVVARLVLGYPDAGEAEAATGDVEDYLTDGTSLTGTPWAELLTVEDVSVQGSVVVVDLTFEGEQRPNVLVQVLLGNVQDLPQVRA